jgi:YesN/AraC family two-component response regulator
MNILLVDDELAMLQILQKVMNWKELGIDQVYTARNAAKAKEILLEKQIDITVCDIEMPEESGLDLIGWIQGLYPGIINIILTAHADFNYARSAISLGVYQFLLKPVSFEELSKTIREAVEKTESEKQPPAAEGGSIPSSQMTAVEEVRLYLEKHYHESITRSDVEKLVHLNRDYLNREFKAVTGYTLIEYIQYYRILMAKRMITETSDSISEICIKIGYDSPAYFSKIFKKQTGLTPMEYRNQGR